jgi:hypothetical protein
MKPVLQCAVMLVMVLLGVPGYTAERLVPYDDFNATLLDPNKWFGLEFGGAGTEALRQVQDQRLRLVYRGYGQTDADHGRQRNELLLVVRNPAAVTAMQATVQVDELAATGCPSNPDAALAMAILAGRFFNIATPTPGSGEHDVIAHIGVRRMSTAPPDVLQVASSVIHCRDAHCMDSQPLHFRDLGPVTRGERVKLRLQWDRDQHRFVFQRDDAPEVLAPYAVSDTAPPGIQAKLLDAIHLLPNCTAAPRPMAVIEAWFDDVMVNESAAPRAER